MSSGDNVPIITVDVEDWPQSTFDRSLPITQRAADNTLRLLDLLDVLDVKATMFVLGKFVEAFPEVVRRIDRAGHEVANHGHGHVEIFRQTRVQFAQDLQSSQDRLAQVLGKPIKGYRAPDFSIVRQSLWALETLAENGVVYDSSIFPISGDRYGIAEWPREPVRVRLASGLSILELPIATLPLFGRNWPIGGGGYHRLLPGFVFRLLARTVLRSGTFMFYCHPYEFDPREFREIDVKVPLTQRLHQGLGRSRFRSRFERLIRGCSGRRLEDALHHIDFPDWEIPSPVCQKSV